jgi:hypothetical protein
MRTLIIMARRRGFELKPERQWPFTRLTQNRSEWVYRSSAEGVGSEN